MLNKQVIVLAGGFGTRLQSVLKGLPKPLADINGTPFLKFLLLKWVSIGLNDFIFSLHYSSQEIIDFINKEVVQGVLKNCKVQFVVEPNPLGTGGAVSYAIENADVLNSFFVANADTWIDFGLEEIDSIENNVIITVEVEDTSRYGALRLKKDRIIDFKEKEKCTGKGYINAGTYKLNKNIFNNWNKKPYSIEKDLFAKLIKEKKLFAYKVSSDFIDIGIPNDYELFCNFSKKYLIDSI